MTIIINKLKQGRSKEKLSGKFFNRSTIFLLPMLDFNKNFIFENYNQLVNIYYHCEEDIDYNNEYKDRLYTVFKKGDIDYTKAANLYNTPQFIGTIEKGDYFIFIFKIPDIFLEDYLLFKKGMFSKMSKVYKAKLFIEYPGDVDYLKAILYPTEKDIAQLSLFLNSREKLTEVYSKPETSEETFKLSNFYKIVK